MATIQTRPYSGDYSGLVTQAAIASIALVFSVTSFELMRRKRRKIPTQTNRPGVLGSVDSWEWGYLYQARCWAKVPAPALPSIPLAWVRQVLLIREPDLFRLVGTDATVYTRFLLGCVCFVALHAVTTLPVLLPLHVTHAPPSVSPRSMTRASLSSITDSGAFGGDHDSWKGNLKLLSVHCALMWWLSVTWIGTLLWICRGAFRLREAMVQDAKTAREKYLAENNGVEHPHQGWRLRTVMVSDIPTGLRDEKRLAEYFRYYMSKGLDIAPFAPVIAPSPGLLSFAVNRLWRWGRSATAPTSSSNSMCEGAKSAEDKPPVVGIEKVVLVRKTTELASLLERREEVLRRLEHAHIKLASKVLLAVKHKMQNPSERRSPLSTPPGAVSLSSKSKANPATRHAEPPESPTDDTTNEGPSAPIPYALASPKVRQNVPVVTVKLATPPSTPSRLALARHVGGGDEFGARFGASSSDRSRDTRVSATTEYFTPVSPTRSAIPPPLPPRPQSAERSGVTLVTPEYGTPLTSSDPGAMFGSSSDDEGSARGPSAVLVTPGYKTPPVSPRTGAAELGYNVRPGGTSSTSPYGDRIGLGLPSLGRAAKGSVGEGGEGFGPGAVANASISGNGGDDPLGLGARVDQEPTRHELQHQRRPSERALIEEQPDSDMDEVIVDRRGPWQLRDVFFSAAEESESMRDEAMERDKRLIEAIGPFVYAFGLLERPKPKASKSHSRANSTDQESAGDKEQAGSQSSLRPPARPFLGRLSSGSSWFSALSSNPNSRTASQSTGQTLVNSPVLGFSAQVLRTHTISSELGATGTIDVRELREGETLWDALHSLPRDDLDRYQPLIHLSTLFKGRTVPAIDFLTTKLALLSALIEESRSGSGDNQGGAPASTAFVTFRDPQDAMRAVKELAVHPKNALACVTTPAPDVRDVDWGRAMKSTYTGEFLKDWVVNVGVWGFTLLWIFPVTLFVGLVSIDNLSQFIPDLAAYLDTHHVQKELLSSFLPTLLVALLAILIPLLLLLIAKKAHNIITFSRLHDRILTRYYKFLVCNVLIFFCFGVSALQSFLTSFSQQINNAVPLVASYVPVCAPFFVGWLIFQTGIHAGLELGLFGLPLIVYPAMVRGATTPRRREFGTRARTFNYYYWLPNHLLVVIITLLFSILNPLVIPFSLLYFGVALAVFKHQFVHVYRKIYDGNAENIVIRILRYSLDGLMLSQVVLMAVMILLQQSIQAGLVGTALVLTALAKLYLTRLTRSKFDDANIAEANAACGIEDPEKHHKWAVGQTEHPPEASSAGQLGRVAHRVVTWHSAPDAFAYSTLPRPTERRPGNPFKPPPPPLPPRHGINESPTRPTHLTIPTSPAPRLPRLASWETMRADTPLVVPHSGREPWDDAPDHTATYDNPYYTQHVPEYLWLPKNPLAELDLNDTVDLHRALTSEADAGDMAESIFTDEEAGVDSFYGDDPFAEVTGREDIALPAVILERVDQGDPDDDFDLGDAESTGTIFSRRPSGSTYASRRRSSAAFRSFSAGVRRSGTLAPTSPNRLRSHSVGVVVDPALQPNLNVQAQFLPTESSSGLAPPTLRRLASQLSITRRSNDGRRSHEATPVRPNRPRANTGASTTLSVRQALLREVCEEERTAAEERIRQEIQESEHLTAPRKWTKWMYSKPTSDNQGASL